MSDPETRSRLPADFLDPFDALLGAGAEFLVVGSYALARHGHVRATLDLGVLVRPGADNAARVVEALTAFGAPLAAHGVTRHDFERPGTVDQLGVPPLRIDVLADIDALERLRGPPGRRTACSGAAGPQVAGDARSGASSRSGRPSTTLA